jgi:hypothetical protein
MEYPYVCKGLEVQKNVVSNFGECEQDSKGYVGCEDDLRSGVEGDNSLAVVIRTEDVIGGSEMLDIQPLAVLGEQLGDNFVSTEWVVERVKGFYKIVGLSCLGLEDKLMVELFNDIEPHRYSNRVGHDNNLSAKFGNRGQREVKRLECLVNYDGK